MSSTAVPRERLAAPADRIAALEANIARVLRGKPGAIRHAVVALFARGHLLIEDVPGVGKTTPARPLARSVDGHTYPLEAPFLVMATQNAEERYGTYPLPESQMDRFLLRIRIDYPSPEDERRILLESAGRPEDELARLTPVLSVAEVRALQEAAERVHLSAELADYIVAVAGETRRSPHLALGVSPRGQLAWRNAPRAAALADGRDYVLPDDLKSLAGPVLAHRIVPASPVEALTRSRSDVERVLADIIDRLPAPG